MDTARTLAGELHSWATGEMHFQPQGRFVNAQMPTEQDLQDICIGKMADVWRFMISHVRSSQTVRKVKGNLSLKSLQRSGGDYQVAYQSDRQYSAEKAELLRQRQELVREVAGMMTDISVVEKELHGLQRDILQTELAYREANNQIQDTHRRSMLLCARARKCQEECEKVEEITRRIQTRINQVHDIMRADDTVYSSQKSTSGESLGLESACAHEVGEASAILGEFLHKMLSGEFSSNPGSLQSSREQTWQAVENLSAKHPVQRVVDTLISDTRNSTRALRDKILKIDITQDAKSLNFRYEHGQLTDTSTQPSLLQNVHQLIEEAQVAHVKCFMESEKHKNEAYRAQARFDTARNMLYDHLNHSMKNKAHTLQLARKLVDTELELAAANASYRVLTEQSTELQEKIQCLSQEKQALYAKYQKIQNFKTVADTKQNLIRVLVKQNANSPENMQAQQTEIADYIEKRSLSQHPPGIDDLLQKLEGSVNKEVEQFQMLSLPYLQVTTTDSGNKVAVMDLSINRLSRPLKSPGYQMIEKLIEVLEFPLFKAAECVLPQAVGLLSQQRDYQATLRTHGHLTLRAVGGEWNSQAELIKQIEDLCRNARSRDQEKILPMLQKRIHQVSQVLLDCIQVKDTAQAWWEQPAQHTTPFLKMNDLTLQQWREKWTFSVARLRQLQLQQ